MCLLLCNIIVLSVFENCEKSLLFLLSIMILLLILFNLIDMHGKNIKKKKTCDSAIIKREILPFTTMWMNLEDIILREISQTETYHMISLICGV